MAVYEVARLSATIVGEQTTFVQTAGSEPRPNFALVSNVLTLASGTSELFRAGTTGARYRMWISEES